MITPILRDILLVGIFCTSFTFWYIRMMSQYKPARKIHNDPNKKLVVTNYMGAYLRDLELGEEYVEYVKIDKKG